jgi:hypothetical protein
MSRFQPSTELVTKDKPTEAVVDSVDLSQPDDRLVLPGHTARGQVPGKRLKQPGASGLSQRGPIINRP